MLDLEMTVVTMADDIAAEVQIWKSFTEESLYIKGIVDGGSYLISRMIHRNIGVSIPINEIRDGLDVSRVMDTSSRIELYRGLVIYNVEW